MGEQLETASFWHRVCEAIFIKSPGWFTAVQSLPDKLDLAVCVKRTVSGETLTSTSIRAQGWVGRGIKEETKPNPFIPTDFPLSQLQWAFLQFSFQFFQFEGLYNYLSAQGRSAPESWHPSIIKQFIELAQTMTFYSAMLIIAEEERLPKDSFDLSPLIHDEIRKIVVVLTGKTTDYGQAFLRHGVVGMLYRVWDKIARYATLSAENRSAKFESRKDTVCDMLGYSVLIWSILEDMKANDSTDKIAEYFIDHSPEFP
jgi:hypothetical protein